MADPTPRDKLEALAAPDHNELRRLLEAASLGELIADTHHRKDCAGRSHGFIRNPGELAPVGAIVLNVEGMPDDQGVARLQLLCAAVNALPALLAEIERLREALERVTVYRVEDDERIWLNINGFRLGIYPDDDHDSGISALLAFDAMTRAALNAPEGAGHG